MTLAEQFQPLIWPYTGNQQKKKNSGWFNGGDPYNSPIISGQIAHPQKETIGTTTWTSQEVNG